MAEITYLRQLRLQYGIELPELAKKMDISPQQLSRLELGQAARTPAQENKIFLALQEWIHDERRRLNRIEWECTQRKGKLLTNMEGEVHES